MRRQSLLVLCVSTLIGAAVIAACSSDGGGNQFTPEEDGGPTTFPPVAETGTGTGTETPSGSAGTGEATGLPCEVQAVLENTCITCHNKIDNQGPTLLNFEDLSKPSTADPTKTRAALSVDLMKAKQMPKPPAEPAEADEIAAFEDWVKAGLPRNATACTDPPPVIPDGGLPDSGANGDGGCTSGKLWTKGNEGSELMHPGGTCLGCHAKLRGPKYRFAGTVYPTLREPLDCNGSSPPITVTVAEVRNGQLGKKIEMPINAAGNFFTNDRLQPPLKAFVTQGGKTRAMNGTLTAGDCNSCHTQAGANGAPGRILAPQ